MRVAFRRSPGQLEVWPRVPKVCALDGRRYRNIGAHLGSRAHARAVHPPVPRRVVRANLGYTRPAWARSLDVDADNAAQDAYHEERAREHPEEYAHL